MKEQPMIDLDKNGSLRGQTINRERSRGTTPKTTPPRPVDPTDSVYASDHGPYQIAHSPTEAMAKYPVISTPVSNLPLKQENK